MIHYQQNAAQLEQPLQDYLVTNNLISELKIALLISEHFDIPYLDLDSVEIELTPWHLITDNLMRKLRVAPLMIKKTI